MMRHFDLCGRRFEIRRTLCAEYLLTFDQPTQVPLTAASLRLTRQISLRNRRAFGLAAGNLSAVASSSLSSSSTSATGLS